MNLVNIAKHLHLTQLEFCSEDSPTSADETFASQQLFEILKTFEDGYFHELYTYQSLDFHDEYDETTDEEDSADEEELTDEEQNIGDYDENESLEIQTNFTLEEMEKIVEWVVQHPNYKFASIKNRFRKEKENEFGKRVEKDLIVPPNVVVRASKSGKSNDEKHRIFLNAVLRALVDRKFLIFLDCWTTQADLKKFRALFPHQDSQLLIFPKGSTGYI
ncbi:unnamed protein product [Rotaria sp. Silwood1]|nr:unnamed protein product [Rotaria sp. Silwood1]CAF1670060.1 unnamed protein product [Rotaria sp. Silwood1]